MKKNKIVTLLICSFIVFAGICYSCSYGKTETVTDLDSSQIQAEDQIMVMQEAIGDVDPKALHELEITPKDENHSIEEVKIKVHVCGAVNQPGVYEVESNGRIVDAIQLSGGLTEAAAGDYINQAMKLSDGMRVYIPTLDEVTEVDLFTEYGMISDGIVNDVDLPSDNGLININYATEQELMVLPGIGEAKSKGIVAYRDANGAFQKIEDLMKIPGIKDGLFNQIASLITVK